MPQVVETLTPPIPDVITPEWQHDEFVRMRQWQAHVDEALKRYSTLPNRLAEMEGAKMCARAAAATFNHLDTELRQMVEEAHAKVSGIVGADGGLILSADQPLAAEAIAAVAAQVAAA